MKRSIMACAIILGCASAAWAGPPPSTLTTLQAIHAVTNAQADQHIPVAFEATVTYFRGYEKTLFVQDGDVAIFVRATTDAKLVPGDRILIRGTMQSSFRPNVVSSDIVFLHHGTLPKPVPADFDQLIRAQRDCLLVSVKGTVRTADLTSNSMTNYIALQMLVDGGTIDVAVDSTDPNTLQNLLDADVEIVGAESGQFDGKLQQTGVLIHVASLADVKIIKHASTDPWSIPDTPMDEILIGYHVSHLSQRIRVQGTVTYYDPGDAVVLQNGSKSLWIMTQSIAPLRIGDHADATGFPDVHDGFLTLVGSEIRKTEAYSPISPLPVTWRDLVSSKHVFDLVSIEGRVVTSIREPSQDEYVLVSDGYQYSAIYRHPEAGVSPLPPMAQIPVGASVRVAGICVLESSNPFNRDVPFNILLRSFDDIQVIASPSLLNVRNLIILVGLLFALVVAVGARGWAIERNVSRQTAALAYVEQRRSRILEDINGSRPLAEIVEDITELVSFKLRGAPCWCQIADGARLGNCPPNLTGLRIVQSDLLGRTGPPLGAIFAAFDTLSKPSANELEALSMAAGLTALAIETRRLYSDLLHRSEFDLLTDIHNRFSLDKHLDTQIEEARQQAGIFGLVYIDLDDFKQVNDRYGHRVGDLYLQEVAIRMKRQLRSVDMLARLGGDEFAVLLPLVRNRTEVEEIALRLYRCLDDPFSAEGCVIHGSASVGIALYPEDATTKEGLLSAADGAMYVVKNTRHEMRESPPVA